MLIRQPNRSRFIRSLDNAIQQLNSDAQCYHYVLYDEYKELSKILRDYRKKLNTTGIRYEILLGNDEGFFESGHVVYGDGTSEPLVFCKNVSDDNITCYMVQEWCCEQKNNYPVRWQHVTSNGYKELHIYLLTDRIQDIFFTNQSATDIVISGAGEPIRLCPGQMERVINRNYYKPVPSRRKAKYEVWIESDHLHGAALFDGEEIKLKIDHEGNSVDVLDVTFGKKYVARWRQFYQMIDFSDGMPEVDLTIHNHSGRDFFVQPGYEALPDGETWTFEIEH